jgi:hypothetical protein
MIWANLLGIYKLVGSNMLKIILLLASLVVLAYQPCMAQTDDKFYPPTRFEISANKNTYYVAEPMLLTCTLYNDLDKPIKINKGLGVSRAQTFFLYYNKVGNTSIRYFNRQAEQYGGTYGRGNRVIQSLSQLSITETVFYNTQKEQIVFSEPGEYEFKARTNTGNNHFMDSNVVRVKVINPPKKHLATTQAILADKDLISFIEGDIWPNISKPAEIERAAEKAALFIETHSQSVYIPLLLKRLVEALQTISFAQDFTAKMKALYDIYKPRYDALHPPAEKDK